MLAMTGDLTLLTGDDGLTWEHVHDVPGGDLPPGDSVKCGNRTWRFKKNRRHAWQELGTDVRNLMTPEGFAEGVVSACLVCGVDKFSVKEEACSD